MTGQAQATFAGLEYGMKKRRTRREKFLERMEGLIPWEELEAVIRPHYPKAGRGRRLRRRRFVRVACGVRSRFENLAVASLPGAAIKPLSEGVLLLALALGGVAHVGVELGTGEDGWLQMYVVTPNGVRLVDESPAPMAVYRFRMEED